MQKLKQLTRLTIIPILATLYGCASDYPCGEPGKGKCLSVTDNYKRSYSNYTNPDDLDAEGINWSSSSKASSKMNFNKYAQIPHDGAPLLSTPKMVRIWITSFTDGDNIYHDQSYEYVIVDKGHWNYSNNKLLLDNNLKNVYPTQVSASKNGGYGSFGLGSQQSKTAANPVLKGFPAINSLQNQRAPIITTTTVGSGIDRTAAITP